MMRISAQALTSAASPPLLGLGKTTAAPLFAPGESGDTYPYRLAKQHHSPKPTVHSLDHGYASSTMRHPFVGAEPQFMG
jgi:hypothetical protein